MNLFGWWRKKSNKVEEPEQKKEPSVIRDFVEELYQNILLHPDEWKYRWSGVSASYYAGHYQDNNSRGIILYFTHEYSYSGNHHYYCRIDNPSGPVVLFKSEARMLYEAFDINAEKLRVLAEQQQIKTLQQRLRNVEES